MTVLPHLLHILQETLAEGCKLIDQTEQSYTDIKVGREGRLVMYVADFLIVI
jgi:hypothetical protein